MYYLFLLYLFVFFSLNHYRFNLFQKRKTTNLSVENIVHTKFIISLYNQNSIRELQRCLCET